MGLNPVAVAVAHIFFFIFKKKNKQTNKKFVKNLVALQCKVKDWVGLALIWQQNFGVTVKKLVTKMLK